MKQQAGQAKQAKTFNIRCFCQNYKICFILFNLQREKKLQKAQLRLKGLPDRQKQNMEILQLPQYCKKPRSIIFKEVQRKTQRNQKQMVQESSDIQGIKVEKKWPFSKFIELSYLAQNLQFKDTFSLALLMAIQTLLLAVIPVFSLIPGEYSISAILQNYSQIISYKTLTYFQNQFQLLITQAVLFTLMLAFAALVLSHKKERFVNKTLVFLALFHHCSPVMLYLDMQVAQQARNPQALIFAIPISCQLLLSLNIALILTLNLLYIVLFHTCSPEAANHLCTRSNSTSMGLAFATRILLMFLPFVVASSRDLPGLGVLFMVFMLLITLAKIHIETSSTTFYSSRTRKIFQYLLALQFSIICSGIAATLTIDVLICENVIELAAALWLFSYLTLRSYKGKVERDYQILSPDEIKHPIAAEMYIIELLLIFVNEEKRNEALILNNLQKVHEGTCRDAACICREKRTSNTENRSKYEKFIVMDVMDKLFNQFQSSVGLVMLVSELKLKQFKTFADSLWKLHKIDDRKVKSLFIFKIMIAKFTLKIRNFIEKENMNRRIARIDKCIQSQNVLRQIMQHFNKFIALKSDFWNFFRKGNVSYHVFETKIDAQLQIMKYFHKTTQKILQHYEHSYQLISILVSYEKLILLKDRICKQIFEKASKLLQSRQIKNFIFKKQHNEALSIQKWICSMNSCTMETNINMDQMGIVVSASKNVENVFGMGKALLEGFNINQLMPLSMQAEHDYILESWAKSSSWQNLGKLRSVFCVHKKTNVCFSAGIYIKLIQRLDGLNVMGSIFKENDKDFLVIDNNGIVVGAGSKFFEILGPKIIDIPFSFICDDWESIPEWRGLPNRAQYRSTFYSTKNCQQIIENYLNSNVSLGADAAQTEVVKQQLRIFQTSNLKKNSSCFQYEVHPYKIGRIMFSIIKIETVFSDLQFQKSMALQSIGSIRHKDESHREQSTSSKKNKEQEFNFLAGKNSSIGSSTNSTGDTSENKITFIEQLFYDPRQVQDAKITKTTLLIIILCVLGLLTGGIKVYINYSGSAQIFQLYQGNMFCSDTLQLSMLVFNRALSMYSHLNLYQSTKNSQHLQILHQQLQIGKFLQQYLYNQWQQPIKLMHRNVTSLGRVKVFGWQLEQIDWRQPTGEIDRVLVSTFITKYLVLVDSMIDSIENVYQNASTETIKSQLQHLHSYFLTIAANFPTMYALNSANLQYFYSLSQATSKQISHVGLSKNIISVILALCICIILNMYYSYRDRQQRRLYVQYGQISVSIVEALAGYFYKLRTDEPEQLREDEEEPDIAAQLSKYHQVYEQAQLDAYWQMYQTKNKLTIGMHSTKCRKLVLLVAWLVVFGLNISMFMAEAGLLATTDSMMATTNNLIDSQNQIINAYYSFKSNHIIRGDRAVDLGLAEQLLKTIGLQENNFNQIMADSLTMFSQFDPQYTAHITKTLTISFCQLGTQELPPQLKQPCDSLRLNQLAHMGIMSVMNVFLRQLQEYLHRYMGLPALPEDPIQRAAVTTIKEVDHTLIYIFKVWQQIQTLWRSSLASASISQNNSYVEIFVVEAVMVVAVLGFVGWFKRTEAVATGSRIGRIFLLPVRMLKSNRKITDAFSQIVDYRDIR